jgi:hypothetical protein
MSANFSNFIFVVLIYCVIASTLSIRISTHTKVKQDLLVSDSSIEKSISGIYCPQEDWESGKEYLAGSIVRRFNKLYEASKSSIDQPPFCEVNDCFDENWKFISKCKLEETEAKSTSDADAETELCGESRETNKKDKEDADEIKKKIDDEIINNTTNTKPVEESTQNPDTKTTTTTSTQTDGQSTTGNTTTNPTETSTSTTNSSNTNTANTTENTTTGNSATNTANTTTNTTNTTTNSSTKSNDSKNTGSISKTSSTSNEGSAVSANTDSLDDD